MARLAVADGITEMVATPHSPASTASVVYDPALIRDRTEVLSDMLRAEGIALRVLAGTEIAFVSDVADQLERGTLLPYEGTRLILLEPPYSGLPENFGTVLFGLQIAGYRVLMAHPERLPDVQENPNRLIPLIERGVLMQLTAQALTGGQGKHLRELAERLVVHRMIHVLASDSHGLPPRRVPAMAMARDRAAELIGEEAARALVLDTPRALLDGLPVYPSPPRPVPQRRNWW
ncbi:MAG: hypothetical protein RLZZ387_2854 [Chloroflexota bacterium]